jgi:hypothetical protein
MHDTAVPTANFYRTQTSGPGKMDTRRRLGCGMIRFNYCRRPRRMTSGNPSQISRGAGVERTHGGS